MAGFERYERKLALRASATRRNYRSALNKFMSITGLTREQLVGLAERDMAEVELLVQEAMAAEVEAGRKPTTAYMIYKAVRFFLRACGETFQLDREDKPRLVYNGSRRVTRGHIIEIWDSFGSGFKTRNRAILMFLKDSGLRVSDACRLDVEDYSHARDFIYREEPFKVFGSFATQKTGDYAHIHIGPEAVEALDLYIGDRRTGSLFLSLKGGRLGPKAMSEVIGKIKRRRDLREDYEGITAQSLRKYHYTLLPFREDWIRWLEGKAIDTYIDNPEEVTQAYMENYDTIRVFASKTVQDAAQDAQIQELKQRLAALEEFLAGLADPEKALMLSDMLSKNGIDPKYLHLMGGKLPRGLEEEK